MSKKNIEKGKTIAIIVLALLIVFGGSYYASELKNCDKSYSGSSEPTVKTNNETATEIPTEEQSELNNIDIDKYLSLKEGSEKAIIYIARPTCYYCSQQEPIMKNIVYTYGITVNYLNTDKLTDEGQEKLIKSDDYFSEGYGTPLTLIVQNNEIVAKKEGLTSKDDLISFFKEHGFINE